MKQIKNNLSDHIEKVEKQHAAKDKATKEAMDKYKADIRAMETKMKVLDEQVHMAHIHTSELVKEKTSCKLKWKK